MSCPHQHRSCRASAAGRPALADALEMLRMAAVAVIVVVLAVVAVAVLSVRKLLSMVLTAWS